MIRVLRINSGGGYGGPERSIESYTRYGRLSGFVDAGYHLLDFPGSDYHISRIKDLGGSVTLFAPQYRCDHKIHIGQTSSSIRRGRLPLKARLRKRLPRWSRVQWESYGWSKKARQMITRSLESISSHPDICHIHASHYFMSAGIYQACRDVFLTIPVVVHFHNGPVFAVPGLWEQRMIRGADLCLFNSRYCEEAWRAVAKPRRTMVMPNPVEFPADPPLCRSLSSREIVIGTMGRLSSIKGIDVAMRAFARAVKVEPRLKLEIGGEGPEGEQLRQLVRKLGIEERVQFHGFVTDVDSLLSRWHVLLQPTKTVEAFGRTVIEAMACRCAVIASRVGGLPENVIDGETGYVVEPGDVRALSSAMLGLVSNNQRYAYIVESGFRHACRYEAQAATGEMAETYRNLLG
jgi:glycosyltransferase involved in cell wall biosynthesis